MALTIIKKERPSALEKHKIAAGQIFLSADGANHGYLVRDVHRVGTGDLVTVQKITPMGNDGPMTRVDAQQMAEKTHYEAAAPDWYKRKGKKK